MAGRRAAAVIRLANLRVRQGRLEEAAQLLEGLGQHPDAVPVLAGLQLARGELAVAQELLERATVGTDDAVPTVGASTMVGPLLGLLVDVQLARGTWRGRSGPPGGWTRSPRPSGDHICGRWRRWPEGGSGWPAAGRRLRPAAPGAGRVRPGAAADGAGRTRLELAGALAEEVPEVAVAEARAALVAFERLQAASHADAARALLRSLGAPPGPAPVALAR